jgi:restriction endonuclease S subunit
MTCVRAIIESNEEGHKVLPSGWRWLRLDAICRQDRNIVEPGSQEGRSLPYLSLEHIESESGRILREPKDAPEDEGKSTTFAFDDRHVLYGKLRPYLNKVALPNYRGRCTTEAIPLLPAEGVDREFLAWLMRRKETVTAAMREKTGSRMPRANMNDLMLLLVPLPPLEEQRRIAASLREKLEAVARAKQAAEEQLAGINRMPGALLRQAFAGDL